jgi:hypothetical protein
MKLNKIIIIGMAAITALTMAGCGGATGASTSAGETADVAATEAFSTQEAPLTTAAEAMTASEGNTGKVGGSILDYEGAYTEETGKGYSLLIKSTGEGNDVYVTAGFMDEETQTYYIWDIFSEIEDKSIEYTDAVCTKIVPDDQSETGTREELVYRDGTGTIKIDKDGSIIWTDEKVNNGESLTLRWDQELNDMLQEQASTGMN